MERIRDMWKMVDVCREREEPKYNDRKDYFIKNVRKDIGNGSYVELTPTESRKISFFALRGQNEILKGVERDDLIDSYVDRYYIDKSGHSQRAYSGKHDKVGSIKIDWENDGNAVRFRNDAEILLNQCYDAHYVTTNPQNINLFNVTDKGSSFTQPLWKGKGNDHWRSRSFYGISLGFFNECIKELGWFWKAIIFIFGFVFASIITNWIGVWGILQRNIQEFLLKII